MSPAPQPYTTVQQAARAHLAQALGGTWNPRAPDWLELPDNALCIGLGQWPAPQEDPLHTALWLVDIAVSHPGTGLGTRAVDALRAFCERTGHTLLVGPIVEPSYWRRPHFSWLTTTTLSDVATMLLYQPPATTDKRHDAQACIDCGRTNVPTGRNRYGEGPRCASCWSRRADRTD